MRRKIKEIMNKEEGFTLVELLAVIVILGIIVAIAIPAVGSVINRAEGDADDAEQELIVDAARLYFTTEDNPDNPVDVDTLLEKGYLEERANDPVQKGTVTREKEGDGDAVTYSYKFESNGN